MNQSNSDKQKSHSKKVEEEIVCYKNPVFEKYSTKNSTNKSPRLLTEIDIQQRQDAENQARLAPIRAANEQKNAAIRQIPPGLTH